MYRNYLKLFFGAVTTILFAVTSVYAADMVKTRQVSGEIGWVDVQKGELEFNKETPDGTKTTTYRINQNETRVTDPTDLEYLNVADLRAGQYITIEVDYDKEDQVVPKIIVEPFPASEFQQAFGEVKAIDVEAGILTVEERVRIGQEERTKLSDFVFDPENIVVMQSPSKQPVELVLNPGDVVRVEYVTLEGEQQARYITVYSPVVTSTITTTTTTTTRE